MYHLDILDCARLHYDKKHFVDEFSLHIIDVGNLMHHLDVKLFAEKFSHWLIRNNILSNDCVTDKNLYQEAYQPWRLPYNHNGGMRSLLRLYYKEVTLD